MRLAVVAFVLAVACSSRGAHDRAERPRVVSLHEVTTEFVVALGANDRLVAIDDPVDPTPEMLAAVAKVPRVGSLESVLAVHPDVVLGMHSLTVEDPDLLAGIAKAGIPVYLADPHTLDDVAATAREVAHRIGVDGDALARTLQVAPQPPPAHPTRVLVFDCCDPPLTAGGKAVVTDLIARAGGVNVFADLDADWPHVSWEAAVARHPELVVVNAYKYDGQGDVADKLRALHAIPSFEHVPTLVLPLACSLGGMRSLEGFAKLRAALRGPT